MKENYKFKKFNDGWWSVIKYAYNKQWGQWRGPFASEADAQIDCVNASKGDYSL